jgi:hypothetical protein
LNSEKIVDIYQGFSNNNHNAMKISLNNVDIYSGEETMRFDNRHPIYKTLMKLEFEDILRSFQRK